MKDKEVRIDLSIGEIAMICAWYDTYSSEGFWSEEEQSLSERLERIVVVTTGKDPCYFLREDHRDFCEDPPEEAP